MQNEEDYTMKEMKVILEHNEDNTTVFYKEETNEILNVLEFAITDWKEGTPEIVIPITLDLLELNRTEYNNSGEIKLLDDGSDSYIIALVEKQSDVKENAYYMIVKNGKAIPHTARKDKEECLEAFAYELSDKYNNPDVASMLLDIKQGSFDGVEIECKLLEIN
jgi:hypothetical protein